MWCLAAVALATAGIARADGINVIETRQAGQDAMSGAFADIRAVVADKGDVKTLENSGKGHGPLDEAVSDTVPEGQRSGRARHQGIAGGLDRHGGLPEGCRHHVADAADKLAQLAKAGDADGVAAQVKVVGDACAACHRTYRAR